MPLTNCTWSSEVNYLMHTKFENDQVATLTTHSRQQMMVVWLG